MLCTRTWTVTDCLVSNEADPTVKQVTWKCTVEASGQSLFLEGVQALSGLRAAERIPFRQLSKRTLLRWCFSLGVDRDGIEAQLTSALKKALVPEDIRQLPPWSGQDADDLVTRQ